MAPTLAFTVVGCLSMAELGEPAKHLGRPDAEPPPDTWVEASSDAYADTDPSALTDFRPILARYGTWVDDEDFGTIWFPDRNLVGRDFSPYVTHGHWNAAPSSSDATADAFVWGSDFAWGWLPFHYGRWVWTGASGAGEGGWAWIPGRSYAPSWVVWRTAATRTNASYVGWAPAPPAFTWRASRVGVRLLSHAQPPLAKSLPMDRQRRTGLRDRQDVGARAGAAPSGDVRPLDGSGSRRAGARAPLGVARHCARARPAPVVSWRAHGAAHSLAVARRSAHLPAHGRADDLN
jgi:hypothetical protein